MKRVKFEKYGMGNCWWLVEVPYWFKASFLCPTFWEFAGSEMS